MYQPLPKGKIPLRRYLPGDVSFKDMLLAFKEAHFEISYSKFYAVYKTMRIAICSLGNEECETYEIYKQH